VGAEARGGHPLRRRAIARHRHRRQDRYDAVSPAGLSYTLERDLGGKVPGVDFGVSVEAEWRFPLLSIAARYTQGLTDIARRWRAGPELYARAHRPPAGSTSEEVLSLD
jgi:hypothetical protein